MFETLTMRAGLLVAVAVLALLASAGCDKRPAPGPLPTPPLPTAAPAAVPAAVPQASGDPSLPDARAALRAAGAGAAQLPAGDAQRGAPAHPAMTRAQEATAMPLPGQANDHSTLAQDPAPKRAASAP